VEVLVERLGVAVAVIVAGLLGGLAGAGCDARAAGGGGRAVVYVQIPMDAATAGDCSTFEGLRPGCCPAGFTVVGLSGNNEAVCLED
jgi:hypothetical protein